MDVILCESYKYPVNILSQTCFLRHNLLSRPGDHPLQRILYDRFDRLCPVPSARELEVGRQYRISRQRPSWTDGFNMSQLVGFRDRGDPTQLIVLVLIGLAWNLWFGDRKTFEYDYERWMPLLYWLTNARACEMTMLLFVAIKVSKYRAQCQKHLRM